MTRYIVILLDDINLAQEVLGTVNLLVLIGVFIEGGTLSFSHRALACS